MGPTARFASSIIRQMSLAINTINPIELWTPYSPQEHNTVKEQCYLAANFCKVEVLPQLGCSKFEWSRRLTMIHQFSEVYTPTINKRKEELIGLIKEKAEAARNSEIARKMKVFKGFYTLEIAQPSGNEIERVKSDLKLMIDFMKSGAFMHLTVKQAWLLFLVGLEVSLWFFLGETIAKGRIVGYVV